MGTTIDNEEIVHGMPSVKYLNMRAFRVSNDNNHNLQQLLTTWNRAPYASNRTINYHSEQISYNKTHTINELINGAIPATSLKLLPYIAHNLRNIVLSNDYPYGLFVQILKIFVLNWINLIV